MGRVKKHQHQTQSHRISISMTNNDSTARMGLDCNNLEVHAAATKYINQFLQEHNFLELDQLTEEHVEGENFSNLLENIIIWSSRTHFRTRQNTWLGNASKEEQFNRIK